MTTTDPSLGPGVDLDDGFFDLDDSPTPREPIRWRRPGGSRRPRPRRPRYRTPVPPGPANFYPDVAAFVAGFPAPTFAREWHEQDTERRWCSHWRLHTEAIVRLEALWKAWGTLRLDPATGASTWLRDHADPAMAALTSPSGRSRAANPAAATARPRPATGRPVQRPHALGQPDKVARSAPLGRPGLAAEQADNLAAAHQPRTLTGGGPTGTEGCPDGLRLQHQDGASAVVATSAGTGGNPGIRVVAYIPATVEGAAGKWSGVGGLVGVDDVLLDAHRAERLGSDADRWVLPTS